MKGQFTGPCDWVRNAQQLRIPWDDGSFFWGGLASDIAGAIRVARYDVLFSY